MLRRSRLCTLLAAVGLLAGCADDPVAGPSEDGADLPGSVDILGDLELGEPATGEISTKAQRDAYTLDLAAGAKVSLEITQEGSSADIDTTLTVFGPEREDGRSGPKVAADDDSGFADKSKLAGFVPPAAGRYTVVVQAKKIGGGRYRLLATCDNDACEPVSTARTLTCRMTRRPGIPGDGDKSEASIVLDPDSDELFAQADGLDAFAGNYNFVFDVSIDGDEVFVNVVFQENNHVQDETGSFGCELNLGEDEGVFCKEPITIDRNLGTDNEDSDEVHAFDFECELPPLPAE